MASDATRAIARELTEAGYDGLFLAGDGSRAPSVWRAGANRAALEAIVGDGGFGDLARVLAAEVLRRNAPDAASTDVQAEVYARALALTGIGDGPMALTGNAWGLMYRGDDPGALGARLIAAGPAAIGHLVPLLDDTRRIAYVGSKEATVGNQLAYRVKDAAAFFIAKLSGLEIELRDGEQARDAEIDRLREALPDG